MDFNPKKDIPLLTNKVILVTGGTDGLGKESVRQLSVRSPAHIYLASRNRSKAEKVLEELKKDHPGHAPITFLELDLSDLASVKAAATRFLAESTRLDILMCNAGLSSNPATTKDGYELAFGANHLGHALLIQLLLPVLKKTAQQPDADVRVVILASVAEKFAPKKYQFEQMKTTLPHMNRFARYAHSKLANIHYTRSLAERHPEILFTSVHPGAVRTNFGPDIFDDQPVLGFLVRNIAPLVVPVAEVDEGAKGQLWAATGKRQTITNGAFYWPVAKGGKGSSKTNDVEMAEALWYWTEQQLVDYL